MSAPAKHVEESWQAAEFFANKVLMEHRGMPHAAWVRALKDVLMALRCVRMHPMALGYPMSPTPHNPATRHASLRMRAQYCA